MQKHQKLKPWLRSLLFVGILLVLTAPFSTIALLTAHEKNGNFWPYFYRGVPKNTLDIVYMGNSHSKTTFIPEVIDRLLGINSLQVSTVGESIYQTQFEFKEVLHYQDPKLIILEANPIYSGSPSDEVKSWNYSFFYAMPFSARKFMNAHRFFGDDDLLKFYLPFISYHADWKNPDQVRERAKKALELLKQWKKAEWQIELPHKGYENYLVSLPLEAEQEIYMESDNCSIADFEKRLEITEAMLQAAEQDGQQVVIMETPQFVNPFSDCRDQLAGLAERYGVAYVSLLDNAPRPPLWFGDDEHMTQFGALIASVETAQYLAETLDISINKEILALYQRYFFRDYTLEREGDRVTITLIPEDPQAMADMNIAWYATHKGESFLEEEEIGMVSLRFTLPETEGKYFIRTVMFDPAIHYYVRGGFTFVLNK